MANHMAKSVLTQRIAVSAGPTLKYARYLSMHGFQIISPTDILAKGHHDVKVMIKKKHVTTVVNNLTGCY